MALRVAYIIKSSADKQRHICIDRENEAEIFRFLKEDPARAKKFAMVVEMLSQGIRNTELYDKENIDEKTKHVTAIKLFKTGQNIRLYCKEIKGGQGTFYIIVAELLRKKKEQKVSGKTKTLIQKVGGYEYVIKDRERK